MLEFRFLGQFSIRLNDDTLNISSRPAQSLLAYLAIYSGKDHRREKLAGLLWPDTAEEDARRNLRQALWQIRKAFPASMSSILRTNDITIALAPPEEFWMDISLLDKKPEENCPVDQLVMAISAYEGEFLPGFYDEWILLQRERFQVVFEHKIKLLLDQLLLLQQWDEILKWGEHWVSLGQAPEPAYQALMLAYQGLGDSASARMVFRRCVEDLRRRLDIDPAEYTLHIFNALSQDISAWKIPEANAQTPSSNGHYSSKPRPDILAPPPKSGAQPYIGLRPFDEQHAGLFFGRETLAAELVNRLGLNSPAGQGGRGLERNLLILAGPSGCGKSSLVQAGILPAVRRFIPAAIESQPSGNKPSWQPFMVTLPAHPLKELALSLTQDAESVTAAATLMDDLAQDDRSLDLYLSKLLARGEASGLAGLILVIDSFEQVFDPGVGEAERRAFIGNILTAAAGERTKIILILRDEYLPHCTRSDKLSLALESSLVHIPPLSTEDLRRTIETPADQEGWEFQPGLVDLILRDTGDEPGALPFLQMALLETWNRRQERSLTLSGYILSGGVWGALTNTASAVYQQLSSDQQRIARRILMQLTEYREGEGSICRCASPEELAAGESDTDAANSVRKILTDARLIVTHQGSIELAHEALTREWHTFHQWLVEEYTIKL